ncbi:DNA mismatch endonuclease Vsr [Luteimicrobium sp. NPDC057192]|uniref:DNA mismatch endonuclease Vsr n=1 Tax=Luteimicrobium sp. NPDC057192 TaxID=3346042 RepID=UPI0036386183
MPTYHVPEHPGSSSEAVSQRMSQALRRDTRPELLLRRELHRRGLRYRLIVKVPGNNRRTIDIAFPRQKLAVFIDGCFWHGCPAHGTAPKSNSLWWSQKIDANRARDADTNLLLDAAGWGVLRLWEHDPAEAAADQVIAALASHERCSTT